MSCCQFATILNTDILAAPSLTRKIQPNQRLLHSLLEGGVAGVVVNDVAVIVVGDDVVLDEDAFGVVEGEVTAAVVVGNVVVGFVRSKITNFSNRARVVTTMARAINEMRMTQRRCGRRNCLLCLPASSVYARLLYILCLINNCE